MTAMRILFVTVSTVLMCISRNSIRLVLLAG